MRSEHPTERLIHFTAEGTRYCFHKHGQHKNNNVMVTVDLLRGEAWQRCWDHECVVHAAPPHEAMELKARHALGRAPMHLLPPQSDLRALEERHRLHEPAWPEPGVEEADVEEADDPAREHASAQAQFVD